MNKILVGVIVVIALLGLVGSMMVIAVVGSALGIFLISAPVTSSHDSEPEPTIIAVNTHSTADLDRTEWVLTSLNGRSPLAGAEVSLAFASGEATGSGGCNSYSGPYRVEGEDGLAFSYIANTEMGCLEPEGIMEQETQYLNALRAAARFRLSEGQLEIFTAGREVLIFVPVPGEGDTDRGPATDSNPAVTISPTSGPSGSVVLVVASGFPPNTPVSVGLGPVNSQFTEVTQGTSDANGVFIVEVRTEGAPGMDLVFAVSAEGQPGVTSPDLFHITN
jgi:heat shock protein HslJ